MPSTPTTKSQVQAYQFVLRRMQSALVRKDAVMLHDPMRTHSRATIVGVVLSCLGMLAFIIVGFFKPDPKPPASGIVIGEQSGSVYVVADDQRKLIPTFNLASARLILMAQNQGEGEGGGQGGAPAVVEPEVVSDEQLKDIPKGRLQGIPGGPDLLPSEDQLISPYWAVCDQIIVDRSLNDQVARDKAVTESTVVAGVKDLRNELAQDQALLVSAEDGKYYLVYRQKTDANIQNANTVRAEVNLENAAVASALNLEKRMARRISMGLLNAIPSVGSLEVPDIPGWGQQPDGFAVEDLPIGSVAKTQLADRTEFHVITQGGVQRISQAVADILIYEHTTAGDSGVAVVTPDVLRTLPTVGPGDEGYLDVSHYPDIVPTVLDPLNHPVACLGWSLKGEGEQRDAFTSVYVSSELPVPKDENGEPQVVKIGTPSPDNMKIDNFYMRPGFAAAVQSATTKETFGRGNIQLISDRGVRYSIPSKEIAQGLGLTKLDPAPESIIKLLPAGASLNPQDAQRTYDAVHVNEQEGVVIQPEDQAVSAGN
ncbi:MAG: type VII secretion protein EccB [Saccharomonospora viridis]|jgi:type VII secretion protein EccB|nr:type VII secretion protein EccB [Saccharomonospora viridis]